MIISEKEVHELMLVAHCYLRLLDDIARQQPECLSECGNNNKRHVANLLQGIAAKQSVVDMAHSMSKPNFTQEQKDFICWKIGEWYLKMKPLLEGQHNLGYMKEKLKLMVCDESTHMFEGLDD